MTDNKTNPFNGLNNIRVIRAAAREMGYEIMEEIREKLCAVVDDMREEHHARSREDAERKEKLEKYRQMLLNDGIDPGELAGEITTGKTKTKRPPRPPRYRYTDAEGNERTWTGQGRTPAAMAEALEKGQRIEDFLI